MARTLVIVEDAQNKCEAYLHAITACPEIWLKANDKARFITAARSGLKSSLSEIIKSTPDVTLQFDEEITEDSLVGIYTVNNSDDLCRAFERIGEQHLLIILDVELSGLEGVFQNQTLFRKHDHKVNKLYRNLHKDDSKGNLILLATAATNAKEVINDFQPENPRRFGTREDLFISSTLNDDQSRENAAKKVLSIAHQEWIRLLDPAFMMLENIVEAQGIGNEGPGHPKTWNDVPNVCKLGGCFEGQTVEHFKGIFYYAQKNERWSCNDLNSVAAFVSPNRFVRAQTVVDILRKCALIVNPNGDMSTHIQLPGAVGGIFLWRLLRFINGLSPRPEAVDFSVEAEKASVCFQVSFLRCLAAAILTRTMEEDGGTTREFQHLLVCEPPTDSEIEGMGIDSAHQHMSAWQTAALKCQGDVNTAGKRSHLHPLMVPEFLYDQNALRLWWRFRHYEAAEN